MALNVKGRRTKGIIIGTLATLVAGVSFFYTAGMQQHIALAGAGFVFDSGSTVYNPSSTTQFVARLADGSGVKSASMDIFNSTKTIALRVGMPCSYTGAKSDISCHIVSEAEASSKLSKEGEYYAQVRGTDTNGMFSEAWKRVVVDKTAPAITSTQQYVDTPTTATEFKANIDYGVSGLGSMRMIVRDQQGNEVRVGSMPCDHATATCKITQGLELLKPGAIYNVYTWARDAAGNENTVHTSTIRTAPAAPVISSAIAGGKNIANNYTNKYEVVLNWQASQGASQYQYGYWNEVATSSYKGTSPTYVTAASGNLSQGGVFNEGNGKHYLAVRAVSADGIYSNWSSVWVVYDSVGPEVAFKPLEQSTNPVAVTANAQDESGVSTLVFNMFGETNGKIDITKPVSTGPYGKICEYQNLTGGTVEKTCNLPVDIVNGTYWVRANAVDKLDNNSAGSPALVRVVINNVRQPLVPPAPIESTPTDDNTPVPTEGGSTQTGANNTSVGTANPAPTPAPIDAASLVHRQQVALATPVYDGTVLGVSTESEVADDANTPVAAQNSATDCSDDDKAGEVLAAQDEKTSGPWKLLADMWYLWVLALAGLAWWIIAAVRRKREDDQYFAS